MTTCSWKRFARRSLTLVGAAFLSIFAASAAFADHMTGRYSGTGDAAGTFLDLRQSGTTLSGQISGADQGTLTGQTDGGNNAFGTLNVVGSGPLPFRATWNDGSLSFQIQGMSGTLVFTTDAQGAGSAPPEAPAAAADYYAVIDGEKVGPLTLEQLIQRVDKGEVSASDLVWKTGAAEWAAADTLDELGDALSSEAALAAADYYVAEDGQQVGPVTLEALVERIKAGTTGPDDLVWKSGMAAWTPAGEVPELAEVLAAIPPPVPAAQEAGPPPLPGAEAPPPVRAEEAPPPLPGAAEGEQDSSAPAPAAEGEEAASPSP